MKAAIAAGDGYQANYSVRLDTTSPDGEVWATFYTITKSGRQRP